LQKTTNRVQLHNPDCKAKKDLARVNYHMFSHFIKVAIISTLSKLFTHNSNRYSSTVLQERQFVT